MQTCAFKGAAQGLVRQNCFELAWGGGRIRRGEGGVKHAHMACARECIGNK